MKKLFSILTVAVFAVAMAACGDKDNNNNNESNGGNQGGNNGGNTNTVLNLTDWRYGTDELDPADAGYCVVIATFRTDHASVRVTTSTDITDFDGPYNYEGTLTEGNGSMALQYTQYATPAGDAPFSISDGKMTLEMPSGGTYVLEREIVR